MHIEPFGPIILEESTLIKRKVKNQQKTTKVACGGAAA